MKKVQGSPFTGTIEKILAAAHELYTAAKTAKRGDVQAAAMLITGVALSVRDDVLDRGLVNQLTQLVATATRKGR